MTSMQHRLFQQPWPEGEFRFFQLGFVVEDLITAATRWARVYGVGPFHVLPPVEVSCTYRGTESALDMQIAVAQAGPVQIELIEQRCDRASVFRDLFAKAESGFHQLCTVTPDYEGKKAHFAPMAAGSRTSTPCATSASSPRSSRRLPNFCSSWQRSPRPVPNGTAPTPSACSHEPVTPRRHDSG
jgi:hypothetical protein